MEKRYIPNLITGLRLACSPLLFFLILSRDFNPAFWLAVGMAASDGIDGFLAKRYGWETRVGEFLDPLADKVMVIVSFVALNALGFLPAWLVALVLVSATVLVIGSTVFYFRSYDFRITPARIGKFNTLIQLTLIALVLFSHSTFHGAGAVSPMVIDGLIVVVAAGTILSFLTYIAAFRNGKIF